MSSALLYLVVVVGFLAALWIVSHIVEALRPAPQAPATLRWATDIQIKYIAVDGYRLRYVVAGRGPNLVLLHTLRTQLDLFERIVPALTKDFTVYALDYPGHGFSDIPQGDYDADFFVRAVEGFLQALDLRDATLCGVSIGGAIALNIAGKGSARVARVIAINPYDYAQGLGIARSSWLGWLITMAALVPLIGETVLRLRHFVIMKSVLRGGVAKPESIPPALLHEMYAVGNRPGHYRAFISLLRRGASWEAATVNYGKINIPVALVWGDRDWAREAEREHDHRLLPNARVTTIKDGGHFLPLDQPQELNALILRFAGA